MKRIIAFIIGIPLALSAQFDSAEYKRVTQNSVPSFDQVHSIEIGHIRQWCGYFYPNGAAKLKHDDGMEATAPADSFSFEEVYNLLVPHIKSRDDPHSGKNISVYFWDDELTAAYYLMTYLRLEDIDTMRTLMYGLLNKVDTAMPATSKIFRKLSFEETLRRYPLVPGDPPALNEDGTPSYDTDKYGHMTWQEMDISAYNALIINALTSAPVSATTPATPSPSVQADSQGDPAPAPATQGAAPPPEPVIASAPAQQPGANNDPGTHKRWLYAVPLLALAAATLFLLRKPAA